VITTIKDKRFSLLWIASVFRTISVVPYAIKNELIYACTFKTREEARLYIFEFWQVDAFTNTPFKGNPAAVFIHDDPIDDDKRMKQVLGLKDGLLEGWMLPKLSEIEDEL